MHIQLLQLRKRFSACAAPPDLFSGSLQRFRIVIGLGSVSGTTVEGSDSFSYAWIYCYSLIRSGEAPVRI